MSKVKIKSLVEVQEIDVKWCHLREILQKLKNRNIKEALLNGWLFIWETLCQKWHCNNWSYANHSQGKSKLEIPISEKCKQQEKTSVSTQKVKEKFICLSNGKQKTKITEPCRKTPYLRKLNFKYILQLFTDICIYRRKYYVIITIIQRTTIA